MENFNILGFHRKIKFLGGLTKKQYVGEKIFKKISEDQP